MKKLHDILSLFKTVSVPEEMKSVYNERIEQIGAQTAPILTMLIATLIPASYFFDLLIIEEKRFHHTFLMIRLLCTLCSLVLYFISISKIGKKNGIRISCIALIIVGLTAAILVHIIGFNHSYYMMLNLIYLGAMIVPMTWQLCLSVCLTIFLFYMIPIPFLIDKVNPPNLVSILANNIGFQVEMIIVVAVYSHFHTRKRALQIINEQLIINQRDQIASNLAKINELQESRQHFIENITHDLKTPLSVIAGHSEMFRSKLADIGDDSGLTLQFITDAVNQSTRLLDQLTSIAMLDSGIHPSDMKLYDYSEFIRSFCGRFTLLGEQDHISFDISAPTDRLIVRMDLSWMERVVGNLIQNAFKHTPENGSIFVNILHNDNEITTEVRDTGTGIPEEKIHLVFERKYQANEEDRKYGFGLGLSIVRTMIEKMGGQISVRSTIGEGAVFSFTLPLVREQPELMVHTPYTADPGEDATAISGGTLPPPVSKTISESFISELQKNTFTARSTILICEDTPGQLHLLIEALKTDFNLLIAQNGKEGLELVEQHGNRIDLIISDVRMPVMDGIEFCRQFFLDEANRFTPFIFLTAYANEHEHFKGLAYGATDYLQKPFNQRILREKINHWLMRRKHEQLLEQMIDDLENKNEMISRFRSIISHEIRNPLSALYGVEHYLNVLHETVYHTLSEKHQRYWNTVKKTISVAESIKGVLDTVKDIEHSVSASSCRPVLVTNVISDIMDQVQFFASEQKISIENNVAIGTEVMCDISMVRQIMINLLRNACEAVHETGKPGSVSLSVENDDSSLILAVADTGAGMNDEQKKNLFRYKATTKKDGNGIGLYLSMKLLQLQNGKINCSSTLGEGTIFTVKLPLALKQHENAA